MLFYLLMSLLATPNDGKATGVPVEPNERLVEDGDYNGKRMCARVECPEYTVINKTKHYEIRKYPAYKYVVAYEEGLNFTEARMNNFIKLKRYVSGANNQRIKISTAHPIFNRFVIGGNGKVGNLYAMSFFLPKNLQANPPLPTKSNDVEVVTIGESIAYVHPFRGYASEGRIMHNQKILQESLYYTNLDYDPVVFFSAEYNEPWQYFNRYNEIVFLQTKNQPV